MPTTYGNDIVYCLKSHCGVRGYCRQKWVLQVQIICKFSNERTCKRNKDVQGLSCGFEDKENAVKWTSKYGSVIATGYDIGTCDGMNEKGLVASLLFLPESVFDRPGDTRPVMGISIWTQYVLDNFATVHEAVEELKKESFRIDAPHMPNGSASTLHLAITDETGNTAVLEYLDGNLSIHEGKEFQVMTNSPRYDYQLAINNYWKEVGGLQMLPGTNRSSDRFVRLFIYMQSLRLRMLK